MTPEKLLELTLLMPGAGGTAFSWAQDENADLLGDLIGTSMDEMVWLYSIHLPDAVQLSHARQQQSLEIPRHDSAALREIVVQGAACGYTIVLNQLELINARVARFLERCSLLLKARVSANLYATPPNAQGFAEHSDHLDVFVLQLSGEKTWTVRDPDGSRRKITVKPGNALYLPRGIPHSAATEALASIHLTISLARFSLSDMVEITLEQLAERNPQLRSVSSSSLQMDDLAMASAVSELFSQQETLEAALQLARSRTCIHVPSTQLAEIFSD